MKLAFSCFCWAHLSEALLGSILGSHLGTILRARVVIGAIVGDRGAPDCLKAGGSCERTGGEDFQARLTGAQLPPPGPAPTTEKERKRVDVYTRNCILESTTLTRRLPPSGVSGFIEYFVKRVYVFKLVDKKELDGSASIASMLNPS